MTRSISPGVGVGVRDAGLEDVGAFTINDSGAAIYFFMYLALTRLSYLSRCSGLPPDGARRSFWSSFSARS